MMMKFNKNLVKSILTIFLLTIIILNLIFIKWILWYLNPEKFKVIFTLHLINMDKSLFKPVSIFEYIITLIKAFKHIPRDLPLFYLIPTLLFMSLLDLLSSWIIFLYKLFFTTNTIKFFNFFHYNLGGC